MSKTGYFEHWEREHLGSLGKYSVFKSTIESYNKSIEDGNYPLGFLIASSLLEDRIKSVWVIVEWKRRGTKPTPTDVSKCSLEGMLKDVCEMGHISKTMRDKTLFILEERNILTNLSMWNTDRYSEHICEKFFKYFRRYDDVVQKVKELYKEEL